MCWYKCDGLLLLRFIIVVINDLCHCSDCYHPSPYALCCHSSPSPSSVSSYPIIFVMAVTLHHLCSCCLYPLFLIPPYRPHLGHSFPSSFHLFLPIFLSSPSCPFHLRRLPPMTLSILLSGPHCYFPNCFVCIHYNKTHLL